MTQSAAIPSPDLTSKTRSSALSASPSCSSIIAPKRKAPLIWPLSRHVTAYLIRDWSEQHVLLLEEGDELYLGRNAAFTSHLPRTPASWRCAALEANDLKHKSSTSAGDKIGRLKLSLLSVNSQGCFEMTKFHSVY